MAKYAGALEGGDDVTANTRTSGETSVVNDDTFTAQLAQVVMGWRTAPGRFLKAGRGWTPQWKFQPLKSLKDALDLLEKAAPQHLTLDGDEKTGVRVKVRIAGVTGEAHGQSKPRAICYAVARAVGITVPTAVDGRKSNGI